jgi:hypothetical protein
MPSSNEIGGGAVIIKKYTLDDFEKIKQGSVEYDVPHNEISVINMLATKVGAPEYIKTPKFEKNNNRPIHVSVKKPEEPFNVTVIAKPIGNEAIISKIRKHLNKMTIKSFEKVKTDIIDEINQALNTSESGDKLDETILKDISAIGETIFKIASGNGFFSDLYALLYKTLLCNFKFMDDIFKTNLSYCSPDQNYDTFCENTKINDKRRALSLFYVNLMKHGVINVNDIILLIDNLRTNLNSFLITEHNENLIEEIFENIHLMVLNGMDELRKEDKLKYTIKFISDVSDSANKNITNKIKFKCADILEAYNIGPSSARKS